MMSHHNNSSLRANEKPIMKRSEEPTSEVKVDDLADTDPSVFVTTSTTRNDSTSPAYYLDADAKKNYESYDRMKVAAMLENLKKLFKGRAVPFPIKVRLTFSRKGY